ncbi:hypothetical protein RJT34_12793 [Clitoria ternatea]|uniref:Uncharacterized protein n=1 Tax=Clitoria ternatea TaxID=43366 RepID=A0AAN9JPI0_CLITE
MSPNLFSLNSLIERKKPQQSRDELAIVKAAAWAWYQHGSGSEGKANKSSEFDVTRTQRVARPSRYKLEAMRMAKEVSSIHTYNSLLDTYEVQSISRQLDRLTVSGYNRLVDGNINDSMNNGHRRMVKKKRINKGFWPRNVVCRGKNDVVDGTVMSAKCVPRASSAL